MKMKDSDKTIFNATIIISLIIIIISLVSKSSSWEIGYFVLCLYLIKQFVSKKILIRGETGIFYIVYLIELFFILILISTYQGEIK